MANSPDLKGSSFTLSVLHLSDNSISDTLSYLSDKVSKAPAFFASAPVVLDISKVSEDIDFSELKDAVTSTGMIPVGVTGSKNKRAESRAKEAGLAVMTGKTNSKQPPKEMQPAKVVHTPVRSGQQIYAQDSDLIILNHVSAGAEVIADGNIHIQGTLRGRAIAGASGLKEAKIICQDLQAELVSIAGNYWLSDQIEKTYWKQKTMLSMPQDSLQLEVLKV
ncbi:septum site-determining protein MinC [Vibrio sp. JC009]|uniref:septum site-determining protein MinC n=1 Tax=Vibrio sp. JC009 TaxID=2912314 RepID=UPI0023B04DB6|nr:septum site-determining protein MinC [Vibrio sp. JC009]WED22575.1 septum site-determining protein MinC [Vibrio sp. JC009]